MSGRGRRRHRSRTPASDAAHAEHLCAGTDGDGNDGNNNAAPSDGDVGERVIVTNNDGDRSNSNNNPTHNINRDNSSYGCNSHDSAADAEARRGHDDRERIARCSPEPAAAAAGRSSSTAPSSVDAATTATAAAPPAAAAPAVTVASDALHGAVEAADAERELRLRRTALSIYGPNVRLRRS